MSSEAELADRIAARRKAQSPAPETNEVEEARKRKAKEEAMTPAELDDIEWDKHVAECNARLEKLATIKARKKRAWEKRQEEARVLAKYGLKRPPRGLPGRFDKR